MLQHPDHEKLYAEDPVISHNISPEAMDTVMDVVLQNMGSGKPHALSNVIHLPERSLPACNCDALLEGICCMALPLNGSGLSAPVSSCPTPRHSLQQKDPDTVPR